MEIIGYNSFMRSKFPKLPKIPKPPSSGWLKLRGIPAILIPGIIFAASLGWLGWKQLINYKNSPMIFPKSATVIAVSDGDTLEISPPCPSGPSFPSNPSSPSCPSSLTLRLLGVDSPDRGRPDYEKSRSTLASLVGSKQVWLEYDRYQDDKFGRILAWIWINCEADPVFTPPDYMRLSGNQSKPELTENPAGCKQGKLIQEEMVKSAAAKPVIYPNRGQLKSQSRLKT